MGVDTRVRLIGHVSAESVLNFIKQRIDFNAHSFVKGNYAYASGFISFKHNDIFRSVFYYWSNTIDHCNDEYYKECGLEELCNMETTYLSMSCDDTSKSILRMIVEEFGGWIDYNDCDDVPYEPVIKNPDGSIKLVIHVTLEEVYEKFGGVVIIDK